MANYFEIESSSIRTLKREWEKFIDECFDEVNKQYNECWLSYHNEASHDKFMEEYTEESIDEWLRDEIKDLDEWAESYKDDFRETYRKGNKIIEEIATKRFYDDETGYKFTLNFCDGIIEKEENDDKYSIVFSGMYWKIDEVTIHFDPSSPKYTDWIPVRSR